MRLRFTFAPAVPRLLCLAGMLTLADCSGSPISYEERFLSESDPSKRLQLAQSISEMAQGGSKFATSTLRKALKDSDRRVRIEAIEGLLLAAPGESEDAIRTLYSEVAAIGDEALAAAQRRMQGRDGAAVARLRATLDSKDVNQRVLATKALAAAGLDPAAAVDALSQALKDPASEVRLAALFAAEEWGPLARSTLPAMRTMMGESCASVMFALRRILAYYPDQFELSPEDQRQVSQAMSLFEELPGDASEEEKECAAEIKMYHDLLPRALRSLSEFKFSGDCFEFKVEGKPQFYDLYALEVSRFTGSLISDYAIACESLAIKRSLQAAAPPH